jgi:glycosyltransferase involved in cell wall biosynthesis
MRLEILGRGPAESLLEEAALPPERLTRLGHRPHAEALDVLEHWDVGVAPYLDFEGFYFSPLKLVEYMSAGLCPVVSDVGDLAATVEHGRAGVLVPPGDADALAGALVAVDRDRLRLRELGRRAHAVARALPTWPDNARRVVEMLTDALPAGSHASGVSL